MEPGVAMMTEIRGASNAKAKGELDWHPAYASWREGSAGGSNSGLRDLYKNSPAWLDGRTELAERPTEELREGLRMRGQRLTG